MKILATILPIYLKIVKYSGINLDNGCGWTVILFGEATNNPYSGLKNSLSNKVAHSLLKPPASYPSSLK